PQSPYRPWPPGRVGSPLAARPAARDPPCPHPPPGPPVVGRPRTPTAHGSSSASSGSRSPPSTGVRTPSSPGRARNGSSRGWRWPAAPGCPATGTPASCGPTRPPRRPAPTCASCCTTCARRCRARSWRPTAPGCAADAAVRCYGGDVLAACDDEWTVAVREQLRRRAVELLARLAARADAERRDADAERHARRLLAVDPLHEPACRLLMGTLA